MESHYEALGLPPTADEREVRRAYRALLKEHHPDQGGSRERFLRIKAAYEAIVGERAPDHETDGGAVAHRDGRASPSPTYDPTVRDVDLEGDHRTLTVSGRHLTVTLWALVQRISLDRLVNGPVHAATERTVAFFRVYNTGETTVTWRGRANTSFIGDDGFLYGGSSIVTPHADRLPERWCGTAVEIPPGRALDAVVVAQEIPPDVSVEKVLYTQHVSGGDDATHASETDEIPASEGDGDYHTAEPNDEPVEDTERYLFELRPLVRERLDRLPFRN